MKQFLVLTLLIVFSVGAIAPAAFAFECPMMNKAAASTQASSDMPCHAPQSQQNQCDGLCLCLHLSVNHAQVLPDYSLDQRPVIIGEVYASIYNQVHSLSPLPLFKPPIQLS